MVLAAGLEGIRDQLDPGEAVEYNTYDFTEEQLAERGVERLPRTFGQALDAFETSDLAKSVFGEPFHATFLKYKRGEWRDYCLDVSRWERDKYLQLW